MFKLLNKKKNNKGFTLVELVIVIAILAIVVGLLAPQYTKYVEKSRKAADASNMDEMIKAVQVYAADAENEVKDVKGATIELGTSVVIDKDTTSKDIENALKEFCPDYSKMSMKSAKWGGNPTATINITDEGGVEVSYAPANFAKYINAKGTTAPTNQGGK